MAEGTASLLEFYAKGNDGGAVSVAQRVAQSWRAACPGDEVMHGVRRRHALDVVAVWLCDGGPPARQLRNCWQSELRSGRGAAGSLSRPTDDLKMS